MSWIQHLWSRPRIDVDFDLDVVWFRCEGRDIDIAPTLHVSPSARNPRTGLRLAQAIGDRDGYPADAIHIRFLWDDALPADVMDSKLGYFEVWWRYVLTLIATSHGHLRRPIVRVRVSRAALETTRGEISDMIRVASLRGGAKAVELTEEGHTRMSMQTGRP
jgi:hypothetical protein